MFRRQKHATSIPKPTLELHLALIAFMAALIQVISAKQTVAVVAEFTDM
jgi:hypothetical protein